MDIEIYDQTGDQAVSQDQLQLAHNILEYAAKRLELKDKYGGFPNVCSQSANQRTECSISRR